jgi:glycosyltransferase involved in cell wall biosynthesis
MRVLFLFNRARVGQVANLSTGTGHDNHFQGMFRVRKYGIETDFLEPEQFVSARLARWWRAILNIYWMHLPLFPLFLRYDVVFSGTAYGSLLAKSLIGLKRPKWIMYDANISGLMGDGTTLKQRMLRFAVSRADGVVALSQVEADTLRAMFPRSRVHDGVIFLHEGVDTGYFKPRDTPEEAFILSVGLDLGRDFRTIVEAVRDTPIQLKIATKPSRVEDLLPLPQNVSSGYYSHEEMRELYARARLIVIGLDIQHPNDSMGTYAVIEAMACGKALIVTRTKALASYVEDGVSGVFVPPRDAIAMRKAILDLWSNETKRKNMGARARAFAVQSADAEVYARKLAAYLHDVIG